MQTIRITPLIHRGSECIGIYFENSASLNNIISTTAGARWSKTFKCWYVALSKKNHNKLVKALAGKATIDQTELAQYLIAKKQGTLKPALPVTVEKSKPKPLVLKKESGSQPEKLQVIAYYKGSHISAVNKHVIPNMHAHLRLKAYSVSTIRTYLGEMKQLLGLLKDIPADDLQTEHIKRYLLFCFEKLHLTENTLHSRLNALNPVGLKN